MTTMDLTDKAQRRNAIEKLRNRGFSRVADFLDNLTDDEFVWLRNELLVISYNQHVRDARKEKPDIHADWKANAQANAAALNVVWENVSTLLGFTTAQEHLPSCGADPADIAEDVTRAIVKFKETYCG